MQLPPFAIITPPADAAASLLSQPNDVDELNSTLSSSLPTKTSNNTTSLVESGGTASLPIDQIHLADTFNNETYYGSNNRNNNNNNYGKNISTSNAWNKENNSPPILQLLPFATNTGQPPPLLSNQQQSRTTGAVKHLRNNYRSPIMLASSHMDDSRFTASFYRPAASSNALPNTLNDNENNENLSTVADEALSSESFHSAQSEPGEQEDDGKSRLQFNNNSIAECDKRLLLLPQAISRQQQQHQKQYQQHHRSNKQPASIYADNQMHNMSTPLSTYQDILSPDPAAPRSNHCATAADDEERRQFMLEMDCVDPISRQRTDYQDYIFSAIYLLSVTIMYILGLVYLLTTQPQQLEGENAWLNGLYGALKSSLGYLAQTLIISLAIGLLWLALLRRFIGPALWLTVALIPLMFASLSLWSLAGLLGISHPLTDGAKQSGGQTWLAIQSAASAALALLLTIVLRRQRRRIQRCVSIVELSIQILRENPAVFMVSFGLLLGYWLFCLTWLAMFTRLFLLGHVEVATTSTTMRHWVPDPSSGWLIAYFTVVFLWTSAVFAYVERCMISGVVAEWFFHRHDPLRNRHQTSIAVLALRRACSYNFGSVCLAALLLSAVQAVQLAVRVARRIWQTVSRSAVDNVGSGNNMILAGLSAVEGLVENVNSYALVYMAYSGVDFMSALRHCDRLFRRNILIPFLRDNVTKLILLYGAYAFSFACFLTTFNYTLNIISKSSPSAPLVSQSSAWLVAALGATLPFFMIRYCSFIVIQVMDAAFVCYVIDVDTQQNHSQQAHEAFAAGSEDDASQQPYAVNTNTIKHCQTIFQLSK